jgi:H+/Cl- antiporter ClcA
MIKVGARDRARRPHDQSSTLIMINVGARSGRAARVIVSNLYTASDPAKLGWANPLSGPARSCIVSRHNYLLGACFDMPSAAVPKAEFRLLRISILAAFIGIIAGVCAFVLLKLIALLTHLFFYQEWGWSLPSITENPLGWWLPLLPAAGGLVVGLMSQGAPQIQGHGIPEAMEAVLFNRSRISPRIALLKPVSAALAIGTGGPFGAEGPIIQTGGAIGSLLGQLFQNTASERKVLLASGAAAGMAATFSTPIAAVIMAIELLLFEFKSRSFIPLVIASTLATNVHFLMFGWGPLFKVDDVNFGLPDQLPYYAGLGILAGGAAVIMTRALYWTEDFFEKMPGSPVWRPVIGGLVFGFMAMAVPRILGVGYETITDILNNRLEISLLLAVMVFKFIGMLVTLGSGTSGGLLAPSFMSSAAMGAAYAALINLVVPGAGLAPGAYALAAMAAVFGAASRSTFAFVVFAFEITRNYNAILPIMLVAVIADGIGLVFLRNSIQTEKLARRGLRIHQEYEPDPLQQMAVCEVMKTSVPTLAADSSVSDAAHSTSFHEHRLLPLVDAEDRMLGVITRGDVLRSLQESPEGTISVLQAGSRSLVLADPDEPLSEAVARMLEHKLAHLPVVDRDNPQHLVGMLSRESIMLAYEKRYHEEHHCEPGWLSKNET